MSEQIMESPERFKGNQQKLVQLTISLKSQSLFNGKNTCSLLNYSIETKLKKFNRHYDDQGELILEDVCKQRFLRNVESCPNSYKGCSTTL